MPIIFDETRKTPSADKKDLLNYMVKKVELNDDNNKMIVYLRDAESYKYIAAVIDRMYEAASLDQIKIHLKTSLSKKENRVCFEKDLVMALNFLESHKALSKELKDEINTHLDTLSNKTTPSSSVSN